MRSGAVRYAARRDSLRCGASAARRGVVRICYANGSGAFCMMCDSCVEEVEEEGEGEVGDSMSQDEDEYITLDDMLVCEDGN